MQAKIYLALAGKSSHSINSARADRGSGREDFRGFRGSSRFYGLYRDAVWGLKIRFRGVIFPGSGCIYLETIQYGFFV